MRLLISLILSFGMLFASICTDAYWYGVIYYKGKPINNFTTKEMREYENEELSFIFLDNSSGKCAINQNIYSYNSNSDCYCEVDKEYIKYVKELKRDVITSLVKEGMLLYTSKGVYSAKGITVDVLPINNEGETLISFGPIVQILCGSIEWVYNIKEFHKPKELECIISYKIKKEK